ncbi:hypothetical protein MCI89_14345 [Muricomes sp. OA1]|uniref:hypothetical protein n=1 Tax=Clostridia TaxID=186801 RepID=UPI0011DC7D37|nr:MULTISPECIES: hypothetical protein [Clostridia]MBS6765565.1 hypothetical protein [Clostridium sp.]MCH1973523.1 hypothetical protein [Muricomes sp. OA1]
MNDSSVTPAGFPAVSVEQIDNPDVAVDLENSENAVRSIIEIRSYSNKSLFESKSLINKCSDAMRLMGYERDYGPKKVDNVSDKNIFRMVARFKRIVSSVEDIDKFDN